MKPRPGLTTADEMLAVGFTEAGEHRFVADGCRVLFALGWAVWEVDLTLPGGQQIRFDVPQKEIVTVRDSFPNVGKVGGGA